MLDNYMTAKADKEKTELLTVRMTRDTYVNFGAVAALRGLSLSSMVNQFAHAAIRDERERSPSEFARAAVESRQNLEETKARKAAEKAARSGVPVSPRPHRAYQMKNRRRDLDIRPDITAAVTAIEEAKKKK